jgi:hypothetical protein
MTAVTAGQSGSANAWDGQAEFTLVPLMGSTPYVRWRTDGVSPEEDHCCTERVAT